MLRSNHEALRKMRREKGHSTRTLAAVAGISHSNVVRLESGPVKVLSATAMRLADALGVEITDLATVTTEDDPAEVAS